VGQLFNLGGAIVQVGWGNCSLQVG
jgi:hypothetical protein